MKIPKQSKPVRRAGFKNHLKTTNVNKVTQSMVDDESEDDLMDDDIGDEGDGDEGDLIDTDETEAGEEAFEGVDEVAE
jgi:hypothetical protein